MPWSPQNLWSQFLAWGLSFFLIVSYLRQLYGSIWSLIIIITLIIRVFIQVPFALRPFIYAFIYVNIFQFYFLSHIFFFCMNTKNFSFFRIFFVLNVLKKCIDCGDTLCEAINKYFIFPFTWCCLGSHIKL